MSNEEFKGIKCKECGFIERVTIGKIFRCANCKKYHPIVNNEVYCVDCKYCFNVNIDNILTWEDAKCKKHVDILSYALTRSKYYNLCEHYNSENNCKEYKRKWWKIWVGEIYE